MTLRTLSAIAGCLLSLTAAADTAAPDAVFADGGRYFGPLRDGVADGHGMVEWTNGDRYVGGFRAGLRDGHGEFIRADGYRVAGEFRAGLADGVAVAQFADGSRYAGEFHAGYPQGLGEYRATSGMVVAGEFRLGDPNGLVRMVTADGDDYVGGMQNWQFEGEGRLEMSDGTVQAGQFVAGELNGKGFVTSEGGSVTGEFVDGLASGLVVFDYPSWGRYRGMARDGQPDGYGVLVEYGGVRRQGLWEGWNVMNLGEVTQPDGSRYRGELEYEAYHGHGELVDAGGSRYLGAFEWDEFVDGEVVEAAPTAWSLAAKTAGWFATRLTEGEGPRATAQRVEAVLYSQPALLEAALAAVQPGDPDHVELYAISFGGDGSQHVFRREVDYATEQLTDLFGARTITLSNSRDALDRLPMATRHSLEASLKTMAERMNPEQDVLMVFLTSHGSRDHELYINQPGMELLNLPASELGRLLDELPVAHRVVVISACYSGGFIPEIGDDRTMVITAARNDRTSFGCSDDAELTEFGRAFLETALPQASGLMDAYTRAQAEVVAREEARAAYEPSEPQVHRAAAVEAQWDRLAVPSALAAVE